MNTIIDTPVMPQPAARSTEPAQAVEAAPGVAQIQAQPSEQSIPQSSDEYRLPQASMAPRRNLPRILIGGGLLLVFLMLCLFGGGAFLFTRFFNQTKAIPAAALVVEASPTLENSPTSAPTLADTPTSQPEQPTSTPEPILTATLEIPPGIPYVYITRITINDLQRYVVEYQTYEFTPDVSSLHIHFFFNNVSPQNAGSTGKGSFVMYAGPNPLTKYRLSDKPADATQLCALVANKDHTVRLGSGNCVDLPGAP